MRHTCLFHAWTFDTHGQSVAIPEEEMFCQQIDDRKTLERFPAEERQGFVFVQATVGSTMDLDDHLGDFDRELELINLGNAHRVSQMDVKRPSNWKYALDTYFENYHLPSLHRDSFANIFASGLCLFDTWGPHHRFTFPHRNVDQWIDKPESEWPSDALPITYRLFPNTIISVGSVSKTGGSLTVNRLYPQSVGESLTRIVACAQNGVPGPEQIAEIEKSMVLIARQPSSTRTIPSPVRLIPDFSNCPRDGSSCMAVTRSACRTFTAISPGTPGFTSLVSNLPDPLGEPIGAPFVEQATLYGGRRRWRPGVRWPRGRRSARYLTL